MPFMEASTVAHSFFTKGTTAKKFKFTEDNIKILNSINRTLCNIANLCSQRRDLFLEPWVPGQVEKLFSPLKFSIDFLSHELSTKALEEHAYSQRLNGFQCPKLGPDARTNQSLAIENYQRKLIDVLSCIKKIYLVNQVLLETNGPKSAARPQDFKKAVQKLQSEVFTAEKLAKMLLPCSKFIALSCQGKYPPVGIDSWLTFFSIFRASYGHIAYGYFKPDDYIEVPRSSALATLEIINQGNAPQILRRSFEEIPKILETDDGDAVVMAFEWIFSWLTLLDMTSITCERTETIPAKSQELAAELNSKEVQKVILATRAVCDDYLKQTTEGTLRRMAALMAITGLDCFQSGLVVPVPRGMLPVQQLLHQMAIAVGSYTEFAQEVLQVQENPAFEGIFKAETKYLSPMWLVSIAIGIKVDLMAELIAARKEATRQQLAAASSFMVAALDFVAALAAAHAVLSPLKHKYNDLIVNRGNLRMFIYPVLSFPTRNANILDTLQKFLFKERLHPPGSAAFEERIRAASAATYATCKDALIHVAMPREEIRKSYALRVHEGCTPATEGAIISHLFGPMQCALGITSKYLLEDNIGNYLMNAPLKHRRIGTALFLQVSHVASRQPRFWNQIIADESSDNYYEGTFDSLARRLTMYREMVFAVATGPEPGLLKALECASRGASVGRDQMAQVAPCLRAVTDIIKNHDPRDKDALVERTKVLGTLPCSHLGCTHVSTAYRPLKGRICSKCKVARYCCTECQAADWKKHRRACPVIAAERDA